MKRLFKIFFCKNSQSGFTLIELLVSLFVLGIALSGIMYVFTGTTKSARISRNQTLASQLLRETMEKMRNLRDTDWKDACSGGAVGTCNFGRFGTEHAQPDGEYVASWDSDEIASVSGWPTGTNLFIDDTGYYNHDTGTPTDFKRVIGIKTIAPYEIRVIASVSWQEGSVEHTTAAEEYLYNWYTGP